VISPAQRRKTKAYLEVVMSMLIPLLHPYIEQGVHGY
jgi:hypothetical protein